MKNIGFTPLANSQLEEWKKYNKKTYTRIEQLIEDIQKNPYTGIGKPEPMNDPAAELRGINTNTLY